MHFLTRIASEGIFSKVKIQNEFEPVFRARKLSQSRARVSVARRFAKAGFRVLNASPVTSIE